MYMVDVQMSVTLTHISAQSMSTAACVTPLLFRFKAFTVFTPNFSLNLGHKNKHSQIYHQHRNKQKNRDIRG